MRDGLKLQGDRRDRLPQGCDALEGTDMRDTRDAEAPGDEDVIAAINAAVMAGGLRVHARAAKLPEHFRALTTAARSQSREAGHRLGCWLARQG